MSTPPTTPRDLFLALAANRMRTHLNNRYLNTPIDTLPWCGSCHIDIDPDTAQCECWDYTNDAPMTHWPSQIH